MKILSGEKCKSKKNIVEVFIGEKKYSIGWSDIAAVGMLSRCDVSFIDVRIHQKICTLVLGVLGRNQSVIIAYDLTQKCIRHFEEHQDAVAAIYVNETIAVIDIFNKKNPGKASLSLYAINARTGERWAKQLFSDSFLFDQHEYILEVKNEMLCVGISNRRYFTSIESAKRMIEGIEYANYDDWCLNNINKEHPMPDSIYFSDHTTCLSQKCDAIRFGNSPEYVAGYLKYVVLGRSAYEIILSDRAYRKITLMYDKNRVVAPDIDIVLLMCAKKDREKAKIGTSFKKAAALCEKVFAGKSYADQVAALKYAAEYINMLLQKFIPIQFADPIRLWFGIQELTNQFQYSLRQKNQARLAAMLEKQCLTQEDAESILLEPNMEKEGNVD